MFDNPEIPAPVVAPAPASPSNPSVADSATSAVPATPAAIDVQEFEQSLKQFGPDWNVSNWREKLTESRRKSGDLGSELGELKRKQKELEDEVGPFRAAMRETPGFREHIGQAVQQFYSGQAQEPTMQGYTPQYAAPMQGFDPYVQRLNTIENQMKISQFTQDLNNLAARDFPLDQEMADAVMARSQEQGWERANARDIYFAMFGENVIKIREEHAAKAAVEAIQKNNSSYAPGPSRQAAPAPSNDRPDFSAMSAEQFNAWAVKNNERILAGFNK